MPTTYVPVNIPSGQRNPCPAGEGICTRNFNGTDFVVCLPECYRDPQTGLILGLIFGLGVGLFCFMVALKYWVTNGYCDRPSGYNDYEGGFFYRLFCCYRKQDTLIAPVFPHEVVSKELTEDAFRDFQFGNLSDVLKRELMILRVQKRRDLTEYVKFAELSKQPEIAEFIKNLTPLNIPRDIITAARLPAPVQKSDSPV